MKGSLGFGGIEEFGNPRSEDRCSTRKIIKSQCKTEEIEPGKFVWKCEKEEQVLRECIGSNFISVIDSAQQIGNSSSGGKRTRGSTMLLALSKVDGVSKKQVAYNKHGQPIEEISQVKRQARNIYNHHISRKGYTLYVDDLKSTGYVEDGEIDWSILWKKACHNKKGEYVNSATKDKAERIDELTQQQLKEGSISTQGTSDILSIALETPEHPGRVRGVGHFITPTSYFDIPKKGESKVDWKMQAQLDYQIAQHNYQRAQLDYYGQLMDQLQAQLDALMAGHTSQHWKKARQNKKGEYVNSATKDRAKHIDEMTQQQLKEGSISTQGTSDILSIALETPEHPERVRGGHFITPTSYFDIPRRGESKVDWQLQAQLDYLGAQLDYDGARCIYLGKLIQHLQAQLNVLMVGHTSQQASSRGSKHIAPNTKPHSDSSDKNSRAKRVLTKANTFAPPDPSPKAGEARGSVGIQRRIHRR